jgi:hypothetical protein
MLFKFTDSGYVNNEVCDTFKEFEKEKYGIISGTNCTQVGDGDDYMLVTRAYPEPGVEERTVPRDGRSVDVWEQFTSNLRFS